MSSNTILRLALPTPLRRLFDYLPPQPIDLSQLKPGVRVRVPFQSRTLVGVLVSIENNSDVPYGKLKRAIEVLDQTPLLPDDVYKICHWAADYYHYALGEVLSAAMPVLLRKGEPEVAKRARRGVSDITSSPISAPLKLNDAQALAVNAINASHQQFNAFLLDGVTGSGKTEVYLQSIAHQLSLGKQVLVLVPEISLTPQTVARFAARFNERIVALHSSLSEGERLNGWLAAKSGEAKLIIGTRSAVFTPFAELGLIIVDEEHDGSFKQQDRFRYHARDLAVMRASINQIPVVLGSATPSLESLLNVKRERYQHLILSARAGNAVLPSYQLIDLRTTKIEDGLSAELLAGMRAHLNNNQQVMLFLNRRGFAPVLFCTNCAAIVDCKRCDARMVYHRKPSRLHCHHCDSQRPIPLRCENCHQETMQPVGLGTEKLEATLQQHFEGVPIIRVDRDSTRLKGSMEALLAQIHQEPKAILLGTQMLAKGHHFSGVTLVGVIDADSGLFSADFRAAEHMGQLLMQVSGRAGREEKAGIVMIQTTHPEHPLLQTLIHHGYATFAQTLLSERETSVLPPYSYLAVFRAEAYQTAAAEKFLDDIKLLLPDLAAEMSVMGPVPAILAKRKGLHCLHLLVKTNKRSVLQQALKGVLQKLEGLAKQHAVKWVLDVDPVEV